MRSSTAAKTLAFLLFTTAVFSTPMPGGQAPKSQPRPGVAKAVSPKPAQTSVAPPHTSIVKTSSTAPHPTTTSPASNAKTSTVIHAVQTHSSSHAVAPAQSSQVPASGGTHGTDHGIGIAHQEKATNKFAGFAGAAGNIIGAVAKNSQAEFSYGPDGLKLGLKGTGGQTGAETGVSGADAPPPAEPVQT